MGYSEVLCHLCGVSFNIGRIRTPTEPRSAAWSCFGPISSNSRLEIEAWYPRHVGGVVDESSYVDGHRNSWVGECHRGAGCMFAMRKIMDDGVECIVTKKGKRKLKIDAPTFEEDDENEEDDDVEDGNWEERDEQDDESLEYASDAESDEESDFEMEEKDDNEKVDRKEEDDDNEKVDRKEEEDDDDDVEDRTWEERDEEDDEPLEYASDVESDEESDVGMEDADDVEQAKLERESIRRFWMRKPREDPELGSRFGNMGVLDESVSPAWYHGVPDHLLDKFEEVQDELFPLFYPNRDDASEHGTDDSFGEDDPYGTLDRSSHYCVGKMGYYSEDEYLVEHIAGPGCLNRAGYSGHEISAEEMRHCQVLQCLVRKPQGGEFQTLDDDEDFEKEGDFFLSGLGDYMPSRDSDYPRVKPPRHGCDQPCAENIGSLEEIAMPFHPSCFEIFKRASLLRNDNIDVHGLTSWWAEDAEADTFSDFPRDDSVQRCRAQEWDHWKGTEHLAANPLYVPKLREIFQAATTTPPGFSPSNGAFSIPNATMQDNESDPFARLPVELRFEILDYLPSKNIAALRLSSRSFCQLPISYFQKLLRREMPWLWEAWPTINKPNQLPYSFWVTVTGAEAAHKLQYPKKEIAELNDYVNIVSEEMPELSPILEEKLSAKIQAVLEAHELQKETSEDGRPFFLPPDQTDYFQLYTLITRHWSDLRGLRNRKRIWWDCGKILERIKAGQEVGRF